MDPLSIASGCAGLIMAIGSLSVKIHSFVRTCREARGDLDSVSRELLSLKTILELIQEDASDGSKTFPKTLSQHVTAILGNCHLVMTEIQTCITKYSQDRLKTRVAWAINGQGDINKLRSSLEAHKTALEIALDMLALHLTKEIKTDTTEIRNDTTAIKEDTTQILEEIARLQARLPRDAAAAASNDFILQRFFEEMTTYTERALDAAHSDAGANSSKALSLNEEPEERNTTLLPQDSWPYHSMPSSSKQSSRGESWMSSQNPYRDSEVISDTSFPTLVNEGHGQREDTFDQPRETYDKDVYANASIEPRVVSGFEIPVCQEVLNQLDRRYHFSREFTHIRHSTITCSREEFENLDFTFRLVGFEPARQISIILFFPIHLFEDVTSFQKRWDFLVSSICHLDRESKSLTSPPSMWKEAWKQILVHINCDTSLEKIHPSVRKFLSTKGIIHTAQADKKSDAGGIIQAEIFEYTSVLNPLQSPGLPCPPIQVVLTAHRTDYPFHISGVGTMFAQAGWYHSLCALLGTGMVIEMPSGARTIIRQNGAYLYDEFLYQAWANKRDTSGLKRQNGIAIISPERYMLLPLMKPLMRPLMRPSIKKPKPRGILGKILDRLA